MELFNKPQEKTNDNGRVVIMSKDRTKVKEQSTFALFDPITTEITPVESKYLMELLGKSRNAIDSMKHRRAYVKPLKAFVVPSDISAKDRRELMAKVKIDDECWRVYPKNSRYLVSNYGRIQGLTRWGTRVFILGSKGSNGDTTEDISCGLRFEDGRRLKKRFAHLVMETFSPKPNDGQDWVCAHRDLNIWNNRRDNLKWMTRLEFNRWIAKQSGTEIPVVKYDLETGEELDEYRSISEAGRQNFLSYEAIRQCLIGVQNHSGGFGWKVSEDYELKGA